MTAAVNFVVAKQPVCFDAITGRGCLRAWTKPGESDLLPSSWLKIPAGGWLVIEVAR